MHADFFEGVQRTDSHTRDKCKRVCVRVYVALSKVNVVLMGVCVALLRVYVLFILHERNCS